MLLRDWRFREKLSLAAVARQLGISGVNPGGTLGRIEVGSRQPDADMVERIERLTGGEVSAADMFRTRLTWLKAHRPEKFHSPLPARDACLRSEGSGAMP